MNVYFPSFIFFFFFKRVSRKTRAGKILLLSVSHEIIENAHFSFYMLPFPKTFSYIKQLQFRACQSEVNSFGCFQRL